MCYTEMVAVGCYGAQDVRICIIALLMAITMSYLERSHPWSIAPAPLGWLPHTPTWPPHPRGLSRPWAGFGSTAVARTLEETESVNQRLCIHNGLSPIDRKYIFSFVQFTITKQPSLSL